MADVKVKPYECKELNVSDLILDKDNPRFVEIFKEEASEDDLIKHMLNHEDAKTIAENIQKEGYFYDDEALWVWASGNGKYVVREGNRRFAAVKALADPNEYFDGKLNKLVLEKLPCLIYSDEKVLDKRILEKHTKEDIRRWSRLAQAKYAKIMYEKGQKVRDSKLLKLSSLYTAAQEHGLGKRLYVFLENEGKSAILERFFEPANLLKKYCGFYFKKNEIEIFDTKAFKKFLNVLIEYTKDNGLTAKDINKDNKEEYLSVRFGLAPLEESPNVETSAPSSTTEESESNNVSGDTEIHSEQPNNSVAKSQQTPQKRGSVQKYPSIKRKQLSPNIYKIVKELYNMDGKSFPNAKYSFVRIVFENVLKYVLEETEYSDSSGKRISLINTKPMKQGKCINLSGYTNFTNLKDNFANIVIERGVKNALKAFDLDGMNQTIHNYNVKVEKSDAKKQTDNLMPIIEFLLQEEADLIAGLDVSKF